MSIADKAQALSANVWLQLAGKAAVLTTGPVLTVLWILFSQNVDAQKQLIERRIEQTERSIGKVADQADSIEGSFKPFGERLAIAENNQVRGRADREQFQRAMVEKLEKIDDTSTQILERIAALEAVAQKKRAELPTRKRYVRVAKREQF